jgi:hypothetical protein
MLAGRVVQIGRNPLLHLFLKRQQPSIEFCRSLSSDYPVDSDGRLMFD